MKRTLKYVVLGLLSRKPMSGYDIVKSFDEGLDDFWHAKHSQVYPELKKLTEEGKIYYEVVHGVKLETKVYTITEQGREDFLAWLAYDEPLEPTPKDIFKLKIYLSEALETGQLKTLFNAQLKKRVKKAKSLKSKHQLLYQERDFSSLTKEERGDCMVLMAAIMREEAYVQWINGCLAMIEGLEENSGE